MSKCYFIVIKKTNQQTPKPNPPLTKIPPVHVAVNKPRCRINPSQWQSKLMAVTAASVLQMGAGGMGAQWGQGCRLCM